MNGAEIRRASASSFDELGQRPAQVVRGIDEIAQLWRSGPG
ncbi:MAG TPA: hypothetical protein VLJ19_21705 [Variovorax sp.]|nr:hypothetical protein [Variovorax sp.]